MFRGPLPYLWTRKSYNFSTENKLRKEIKKYYFTSATGWAEAALLLDSIPEMCLCTPYMDVTLLYTDQPAPAGSLSGGAVQARVQKELWLRMGSLSKGRSVTHVGEE